MRFSELLTEFRSITFNDEKEDDLWYSIDGYEVNIDEENWQNWISDKIENPEKFINEIKNKYKRIAIIKNLNVDEELRGQGLGNTLMSYFFNETTADIILLIADISESQLPGFDLSKFYENWGFEYIMPTFMGSLMLYVNE